jgi:DNA ligase-1
MFAKGTDTSNFEDLEAYLDKSIKDCCEGLMVKTLNVNSTYEPSKRTFNWLKLKKDYLENGLGDSVDLCVVGADYGSGKRTGWFSSFLMACWNDDLECFQSVCKVATGFSDEIFIKLKSVLEEYVIDKPPNNLKIKDNMP